MFCYLAAVSQHSQNSGSSSRATATADPMMQFKVTVLTWLLSAMQSKAETIDDETCRRDGKTDYGFVVFLFGILAVWSVIMVIGGFMLGRAVYQKDDKPDATGCPNEVFWTETSKRVHSSSSCNSLKHVRSDRLKSMKTCSICCNW